jgi:hypothetical protein
MRRALWEMIAEVVDSVQPHANGGPVVRVTSVYVDMPIEIALRRTSTGVEVLADVPRSRWHSGFGEQRGRLRFTCTAGGTD